MDRKIIWRCFKLGTNPYLFLQENILSHLPWMTAKAINCRGFSLNKRPLIFNLLHHGWIISLHLLWVIRFCLLLLMIRVYLNYSYALQSQVPSSDIITSLCGYFSVIRKWGMKSVCLRKRWGKCYMRYIVTYFSIYWMNINCYYVHCWVHVSIWNDTYTEKYLKSSYN